MKILVIGESGQLGKSLSKTLGKNAIYLKINSRELVEFSTDFIHNLVEKIYPSTIINAAAWTDVDGAERKEDLAKKANAILPRNLAEVSRRLEIPFYHISTDYVFSGKTTKPWESNDAKNPLSVYGKTKSMGEDATLQEYTEGTRILRTAWLYSPYKSNFAKSITRLALSNQKEIYVVNDQYGQPTNALDLSIHILECIKTNLKPGIYHATNSGETSWYEFAREILSLLGHDLRRVVPISSSELERIAPRPSYSVLSHSNWENSGVKPMRDWRVALADQIGEIKSEVIAEGIS